jgi:hypothetical protein
VIAELASSIGSGALQVGFLCIFALNALAGKSIPLAAAA